ncbi:MAG: SHOCT domain-containing protein [Coprothermobacterota bacterium]|nr:SHOCT domain-containing protein [Coprothermobacterota bacterium]
MMGYERMIGYGGHGFGWGGMIFAVVGGLLLLALVIWAVMTLVRNSRRSYLAGPMTMCTHGPSHGGDDRALAILKERYAKGELTKEQFDQMKRDLMD